MRSFFLRLLLVFSSLLLAATAQNVFACGGWTNPDLDVGGKNGQDHWCKKTYETKTDENGVFEIYDLPPGKYFIEPEMPPSCDRVKE